MNDGLNKRVNCVKMFFNGLVLLMMHQCTIQYAMNPGVCGFLRYYPTDDVMIRETGGNKYIINKLPRTVPSLSYIIIDRVFRNYYESECKKTIISDIKDAIRSLLTIFKCQAQENSLESARDKWDMVYKALQSDFKGKDTLQDTFDFVENRYRNDMPSLLVALNGSNFRLSKDDYLAWLDTVILNQFLIVKRQQTFLNAIAYAKYPEVIEKIGSVLTFNNFSMYFEANLPAKKPHLISFLTFACHMRNVVSVNFFLQKGFKVNIYDLTYDSPLLAAIRKGSPKIVKLLLKYGAVLYGTPFDSDYPALFRTLILLGEAVNLKKKKHYQTIFDLIIDVLKHKHSKMIQFHNKSGFTALHIAAYYGLLEQAEILLDYGAAINWKSNNGNTPLMQAAESKHFGMIDLLLKYGADSTLENKAGKTALAIVQQNEDEAGAELWKALFQTYELLNSQ